MDRRERQPVGERLTFEHVALAKKGATLALEVPPGSTLAVMGPAASGKSKFLEAISGEKGPERGTISRPSESFVVGEPNWSRRETPSSIARELVGKGSLTRSTEVLTGLHLWDVRQRPCNSLSSSQQIAACLIEPILKAPAMIVIDQFLDFLDSLILENLTTIFQELRRKGSIIVIATNRPDIGERSDLVVVMKADQVVFSGSPESLKRTIVPTQIEVWTEERAGVRAIAEPFDIEVQETPTGLRMSAKEGQVLTAKLLLEGYGDVRYLVQHAPSFTEALLKLIG